MVFGGLTEGYIFDKSERWDERRRKRHNQKHKNILCGSLNNHNRVETGGDATLLGFIFMCLLHVVLYCILVVRWIIMVYTMFSISISFTPFWPHYLSLAESTSTTVKISKIYYNVVLCNIYIIPTVQYCNNKQITMAQSALKDHILFPRQCYTKIFIHAKIGYIIV